MECAVGYLDGGRATRIFSTTAPRSSFWRCSKSSSSAPHRSCKCRFCDGEATVRLPKTSRCSSTSKTGAVRFVIMSTRRQRSLAHGLKSALEAILFGGAAVHRPSLT
jgi:hypothetical protein